MLKKKDTTSMILILILHSNHKKRPRNKTSYQYHTSIKINPVIHA